MSMTSAAVRTEDRATFLGLAYGHLFGAILAFVALEFALFQSGKAAVIAEKMAGVSWLLILGGFVLVSWLASSVARSAKSYAAQYLALCVFVIAEAIIFIPLLYVADQHAPGAIQKAAFTTLAGFTGLTAIVFYTRKDFSFLRPILMWGGFVALGFIVASVVFGFSTGLLFPILMVAYAGGAVLYDTSKVLHHYHSDQYVSAALELFASIALMMWYVLRIFMSRD